MPDVTYVQPDGSRQTIGAATGMSVMQAALAHDVAGIIGECGGSAMCATCHVHVDESQLGRLDAVEPVEEAMLGSTAAPRQPNSRLGCQIILTEALHGLIVGIPEKQT